MSNPQSVSKLKQKTHNCAICGTPYTKFNITQKVCGVSCALVYAEEKERDKKAKQIRKDKRDFYDNDRSYQLKKAQEACNAYIRERDKNKPCISCGTTKPDIQYCAGHYRTRGASPELRFHPLNIHKQCNNNCNMNLSGNIANYRINLIEKIGLSNVEWLEGYHEPQHLTLEDIIEIKNYYKQELKKLKG